MPLTTHHERYIKIKLRKEVSRLEINISEIPTKILVEELKKREGVEVTIAEPYEEVRATANGPAIILVVTD